MQVKITTTCDSHCTATSADDIQMKVASAKENESRFRDFSPRATDTGDIVSLFTVEKVYEGETYDLPKEQAETLIEIGYATLVT